MKNPYTCSHPAFIKKSDKRYKEYRDIKHETGVWPDEVWNLDCQLAKFLAPRLELMAKRIIGHPHDTSMKEWKKLLRDTAKYCRDYIECHDINREYKCRTKIAEFLGKHFHNLWD